MLLRGHILDIGGIRYLIHGRDPGLVTRRVGVDQGAALVLRPPGQGAVNSRFGENHDIAGANVDFDHFVLEGFAIEQGLGNRVVGLMAAGDHGKAAVAGSFVGQREFHQGQAVVDLAEFPVIGMGKGQPFEGAAVQVVAGAALVHQHQPRPTDHVISPHELVQIGFQAGVDHQLAEGLAVGPLPGDQIIAPTLPHVAGQRLGITLQVALFNFDLVIEVVDGLMATTQRVGVDEVSEHEVAVEVE